MVVADLGGERGQRVGVAIDDLHGVDDAGWFEGAVTNADGVYLFEELTSYVNLDALGALEAAHHEVALAHAPGVGVVQAAQVVGQVVSVVLLGLAREGERVTPSTAATRASWSC